MSKENNIDLVLNLLIRIILDNSLLSGIVVRWSRCEWQGNYKKSPVFLENERKEKESAVHTCTIVHLDIRILVHNS